MICPHEHELISDCFRKLKKPHLYDIQCRYCSLFGSALMKNVGNCLPNCCHYNRSCLVPNGRNSFQLFVGVFGTCLVWYLLVLPSETHAVASMTSCRAVDGDTSYHSCESLSLPKYLVVSYYLRNTEFQFEVDPGSMAFDLDIDVPLLIGTIPLMSTFSDFAQQPPSQPMGFADPSRGVAPPPPPPAYQYHQPPFATTYPDIRELRSRKCHISVKRLQLHILLLDDT